MKTDRVYLVTDTEQMDAVHLVRAKSPAQAIRHVTRERYFAEVAPQDDLIKHVGNGVEVQAAGAEAA